MSYRLPVRIACDHDQTIIVYPSLDATSSEFDVDAKNPVVIFMPEISKTHMGGTMRLGLRPTVFQPGTETWSKARKLYGGAQTIYERHRHRYEVNPAYIERLESSGLKFIGKDEKGERMQLVELPGLPLPDVSSFELPNIALDKDHPYFLGLQAHPEFCTRPLNPSPLFLGFVAAASGPSVLAEQVEIQTRTFRPPHPEHCMVSEEALRNNQRSDRGVFVNGDAYVHHFIHPTWPHQIIRWS
jgi:CTP synthase